MMRVTSLEVYNTVYNITEKNNKLQILLKYKQLNALELETGIVPKIKDSEKNNPNYEFIEEANTFLTTSYKKRRNF